MVVRGGLDTIAGAPRIHVEGKKEARGRAARPSARQEEEEEEEYDRTSPHSRRLAKDGAPSALSTSS